MTNGLTRRMAVAIVAALALGLSGASAAAAESSASSNWAGYAVHRSGVRFRAVVGSWTQPRVTCTAGRASYSSVWLGIGGYSVSSPALEQIGTELDCARSGGVRSGAWYELVPAASHDTSLKVDPGDRVRASVTVAGTRVTLAISDLTRHRSFERTLHTAVLDTTSVEWIVEAPSACTSVTECHTLPLADFGSTMIWGARATTTTGHAGAISDRRWNVSRISLAAPGPNVAGGGRGQSILAAPARLTASGSAFTVSFRGLGTTPRLTQTRCRSAPARPSGCRRGPVRR